MVSKFAMDDIATLSAEGICLAPEQIVRLNELGTAVERARDTAAFVAAPRVAWAGGHAVFQPTIQSELWVAEYARVWWHGRSLFYAVAWALCHAREPGFFAPWTEEKATRRVIVAWWRSLGCDMDEMSAAMDYAALGERELPPAPEPGTPAPSPEDVCCPYVGLVDDIVAAGLGMSIAEALAQTPARLMAILRRWSRNQIATAGGSEAAIGAELYDKAFAKYCRMIGQIRKAHAAKEQASNVQ